MALTLRSIALAAAVCSSLPLAAQASVVVVDFEGLVPGPNVQIDLLTTQPYSAHKLTFSAPSGGVFAAQWDNDVLIGFGIPQPPVGDTFAGASNFTLNIDISACTPGANANAVLGCFNRLSMNTFSGRGTINVFDNRSTTTAALVIDLSGTSGTGSPSWNTIGAPDPLGTVGLINKIVFSGNAGGPIYFDDLNMSYVGGAIIDPGTGGGTLPEPGGLALAGLALAGLVWTRRTVGKQPRA